MKIHFENVGRSNKTWTVEMKGEPTGIKIVREIQKERALGSSNIELDWNDDGKGGEILVGGFRPVGTFKIEREVKPSGKK